MGYIGHILIALASLAIPELFGTAGVELPGFVPALFAVPYLLGAVTRRVLIAGRFRLGAFLERLLTLSPALLQVVAVFGLGWLQTLESWTGREIALTGWPGLELMLGLVPFFVAQLCAIDARLRLLDEPRETLRSARAFQVRLLLSALLPFGIYLGVASIIGLDESWRVHIEEVGLIGACFSALLLVVFVGLVPTLLRNTWDTEPLPAGPLRSQLEDLARRADFRCREILVWKTGNQMANAAIVGFTPRSRVVLLSDLLIAHLSPRELLSVFAHEMGHAKRRHAMTFASFALIAFLGIDLLLTQLQIEQAVLALSIFAGVLVLWYFGFGMLSRRFELEADLVSLELMGDSESLTRALAKVGGAHAHERSSWRHFSSAQRTRFLREAEQDSAVGLELARKLRRWSRLGFVVLAVVASLQAWQLVRSWHGDKVLAELRLGEYEAAVARAEKGELEQRLAELVAAVRPFAREHPPVSVEELQRRALESLRAGDLRAALDRVELAILRGCDELEPVFDVLEARLELAEARRTGDTVALDTELERMELPPPWDAALGKANPKR